MWLCFFQCSHMKSHHPGDRVLMQEFSSGGNGYLKREGCHTKRCPRMFKMQLNKFLVPRSCWRKKISRYWYVVAVRIKPPLYRTENWPSILWSSYSSSTSIYFFWSWPLLKPSNICLLLFIKKAEDNKLLYVKLSKQKKNHHNYERDAYLFWFRSRSISCLWKAHG